MHINVLLHLLEHNNCVLCFKGRSDNTEKVAQNEINKGANMVHVLRNVSGGRGKAAVKICTFEKMRCKDEKSDSKNNAEVMKMCTAREKGVERERIS